MAPSQSSPRHRSESRRLSGRRRPTKTIAHKFPGVSHEADAVRVFSRSADKWVDGEVVKFVEDSFVRVEYEIGEYWCGKTLHIHSDHLAFPLIMPPGQEYDPVVLPAFPIPPPPPHPGTFPASPPPLLRPLSPLLPPPPSSSAASCLTRPMFSGLTLREYLAQKHVFGNNQCYRPSTFDFGVDGYVHVESGVVVHFRPIRMGGSCAGPFQVLFHYTQKRFFDLIVKSKDSEGREASMLVASQDLTKDCDFGAGVYATALGPDEFPDGIKGILLNNYPRKGPWGFAGNPGEQHFHLVSHCIPVIAPLSWTKSYPLTLESPTTLGCILERRMRQGHSFDPDCHDIYVIQSIGIQKGGCVVDDGLNPRAKARCRQLMASLGDAIPDERHRAVMALGVMVQSREVGPLGGLDAMVGEALMRCFNDADTDNDLRMEISRIVVSMSRIGASVVQDLIGCLLDENTDVDVKCCVLEAVSMMAMEKNAAALQALMQLLQDTAADVRLSAVECVSKVLVDRRSPGILPNVLQTALIHRLEDADENVRSAASRTIELGYTGCALRRAPAFKMPPPMPPPHHRHYASS